MTLPATTYAYALALDTCDICRRGYAGQPGDGGICEPCWHNLHDDGRVQQFRDLEDGSFRVLVDGRDVL